MSNITDIHGQAVHLLRDLCTPNGILASLIEADNYKRIWARDSIVSGLAGVIISDDVIIEGLKNSLLTLAEGQHESGMIPSNVHPEDVTQVSYGSLAGRIDTNTWFIVGVCLYVKATNDIEFLQKIEPSVESSRSFLKSVEFNGRGWIYTPLSGNWADEYPVHGYTLYDNMLRIWAEQLWHEITDEPMMISEEMIERSRINFWPSENSNQHLIYQESAHRKALQNVTMYFGSYILPGFYDQRFDAAGNALAILIFGLNTEQLRKTSKWVAKLRESLGRSLVPAFWPIINENHKDWHLLQDNYSYEFKNQPGKFHNGGIWPVWMGLYCLALSISGLTAEAAEIVKDFVEIIEGSADWDFHEYADANDFSMDGKTKMGYTASGIVFMKAAINDTSELKKLLSL